MFLKRRLSEMNVKCLVLRLLCSLCSVCMQLQVKIVIACMKRKLFLTGEK